MAPSPREKIIGFNGRFAGTNGVNIIECHVGYINCPYFKLSDPPPISPGIEENLLADTKKSQRPESVNIYYCNAEKSEFVPTIKRINSAHPYDIGTCTLNPKK
jgi:hypothetical protein